MRGSWADAQTFVLEYDTIAVNDHINFRLIFQDDQVVMKGLETDHELGVTIAGQLQNP